MKRAKCRHTEHRLGPRSDRAFLFAKDAREFRSLQHFLTAGLEIGQYLGCKRICGNHALESRPASGRMNKAGACF